MANQIKKNTILSSNHWIFKSNTLNEIRNNRMTISQVRLFSIYLSKINPTDLNSREVTFKLDEYIKIMQFKQTNTTRLIKTAEDLLGLTATFRNRDGNGGFLVCQIFKRFKLYKNDEGEWIVSIDCHDDMLRLMFELRGYYFKFRLWNALQLTSTNQQRMYEILKQYEYAKVREISVKDLREFLGILPEEYPQWERFRIRVLDATQEALARYTDIKFTWEVTGKKGKGGKINNIRFNIEKNNDYERRISLDEYLLEQIPTEFDGEPMEFNRPEITDKNEPLNSDDSDHKNRIDFLVEALNNEFTFEEVDYLNTIIFEHYPDDQKAYNYLAMKFKYIEAHNSRIKNSRYGYLRTIIEADIEKRNERKQKNKNELSSDPVSIAEATLMMDRLLEEQEARIKARSES